MIKKHPTQGFCAVAVCPTQSVYRLYQPLSSSQVYNYTGIENRNPPKWAIKQFKKAKVFLGLFIGLSFGAISTLIYLVI